MDQWLRAPGQNVRTYDLAGRCVTIVLGLEVGFPGSFNLVWFGFVSFRRGGICMGGGGCAVEDLAGRMD